MNNFLEFLEGLLFLFISLLPYLILLGIFLFIVLKIRKAIKKRKTPRAAAVPPVTVNVQEVKPEVREAPVAEVKEETEKK